MIYVKFIEDTQGDVVEILYACSRHCADTNEFPEDSAWPGRIETDYDVYCSVCGNLMWDGIE